jgi:hypothetical protein
MFILEFWWWKIKEYKMESNRYQQIMIFSLFIVVTLISCDKDKSKSVSKEDTKISQTIVDSTKVYSRFLNKIDKKSYPEAKEPKVAQALRWDFSDKDIYKYEYSQKIIAEQDMGSFVEKPAVTSFRKSMMDTKGVLLIKSQGDHTANIVLKDMTITMTVDTSGSGDTSSMTWKPQPIVGQGMTENGNMDPDLATQNLGFDLIFPIPPKVLEKGESIEVPGKMPFNAMGSLLYVNGKSRITLTNFVAIKGHTCARLETDIDISELDVPEELEGKYTCTTKGKSVFYFDLKDRCFISGEIAVLLEFSIDAPAPKFKISNGNEQLSLPDTIHMWMKSDNFISLKKVD